MMIETTPSGEEKKGTLPSTTENINNNYNANNNTNNISNEIDIRTGKVYTTNNKRIPSGRTNSITFHGYGLENNHGAPRDTQHRNSTVSSNMYSSESVFLEEDESQDATDGGRSNSDNGSSFLVKAIKHNITRSRKDSQESVESWNSSDEESDYEDVTVITNVSSNTVDKTDSFISQVTANVNEEVQRHQPKPQARPRHNTLITRPTHPPPKPPVVPSKSNPVSLEHLLTDDSDVTVTDSLKKKVAPIKPQRPSLLRLKNVTSDNETGQQQFVDSTSANSLPGQKSPPSQPPPSPPRLESPLGSEMIDMINLERKKSHEDETEKFEKDNPVDS